MKSCAGGAPQGSAGRLVASSTAETGSVASELPAPLKPQATAKGSLPVSGPLSTLLSSGWGGKTAAASVVLTSAPETGVLRLGKAEELLPPPPPVPAEAAAIPQAVSAEAGLPMARKEPLLPLLLLPAEVGALMPPLLLLLLLMSARTAKMTPSDMHRASRLSTALRSSSEMLLPLLDH